MLQAQNAQKGVINMTNNNQKKNDLGNAAAVAGAAIAGAAVGAAAAVMSDPKKREAIKNEVNRVGQELKTKAEGTVAQVQDRIGSAMDRATEEAGKAQEKVEEEAHKAHPKKSNS